MSGDQLAPSFGDPNAQPPTPKQTPASAIFPSPLFETPKNNRGHFDESSGWTPRFAEEYSVFNSTPGNLRGSESGSLAAYPPSAGHRGLFSSDDIAANIATDVNNHLSPQATFSLSPVDHHRTLPSSSNPLAAGAKECTANDGQADSQRRAPKKVRRGTIVTQGQGQTATPPPSVRKGEPRLAAKLDINTMQNDPGFAEPDFTGVSQQHNMESFVVTTPSDMFGYPLPATAPPLTDQRTFWGQESGMPGMEIDFGHAGVDVFQSPTATHRPMNSLDWGRANQIFQETSMVPQQNQENAQPARRERPIVSKAAIDLDTSVDQSMFIGTYPTPMDNPFGIVGNNGSVDPGLLFGRPQSSGMDASVNPAALPPSSSAPAVAQSLQGAQSQPTLAPTPAKSKTAVPIRRSMSDREFRPNRRGERTIASSPTKSSSRPGLSRSFSESRGKKPLGRASLPTLAPAPRPEGQLSSGSGVVSASRHITSRHARTSGRSSPMKSHHHHRLSSLSSIPETLGPRTRTQATFMIDANGRARVETTLMVEDKQARPTIQSRHSVQSLPRHSQWNSSEDDVSSSEDDDPIVIPSRNTSFVLPDPLKPTRPHPFHGSQRSISDLSTASYGSLLGNSPDEGESEAETVMNDATPTGKLGDAASELRKLRESRQKKVSPAKQRRFVSTCLSTAAFVGGYAGQDTVSPTTLTDASLPTPSSSNSGGHGLRCVCNRLEIERDGNVFMIQCESCEMWLHGKCVNITKRTRPSVYICAFCANTPNMRGGRIRDNGRGFGAIGVPGPVTSPLAHKSLKFR